MADELLNESHQKHVEAFLHYFRAKRSQHVQDVGHSFQDTLTMRLLDEDMYTSDDVRELVDNIQNVVQSNMDQELENFTHTTVLFLQQLLLQAEVHHVNLAVDLSQLDDQYVTALYG